MRKYAYLKEPLKRDEGDDVYKIMLYESPEGFYLFEYSTPDAVLSAGDRLYDTLEDLQEEWDERIDEKGWMDLEDPLPDCQHDAFIPLRVKGRVTGKPEWGKYETLKCGQWVEYPEVKLVEPAVEYSAQIRAYRQEFLDNGDSMDGTGSLRRFDDPKDWIENVKLYQNPRTVQEGRVQSTQYMLVREKDQKVVGMIDIRHYFNDYLEKYGGHIGYSVAPSERRKGYAARMLRMTLPKCKELGIEKVLITCISGNEGSKRTILKNSGRYESTVYEAEEGVYLERYWIELSE